MLRLTKGNLIILSGPSGVGKSTVCRALLAQSNNLVLSISATTRQPRPGELAGREYFFYSPEKFAEALKQNAFLEWAEVFGNYYGTPRAYVEKVLAQGQDCLLEIDVQGALQVKAQWPEGIFVFLVPPSQEELKKRITLRATENEAERQKRLNQAQIELSYLSEYDYLVVNDDLAAAVKKLQAIIIAERCRLSRLDRKEVF
ncbi:MAG TPA: guanylate kinase [Clostridia bacterium]|nr:guanylate kinase [Clostridia bacterium]